ncbi:MAG: hypothetical protein ACOX69_07365 [Coriobacteriales bacterium]|jgi:hypothetical protein
MCDRKRKNSDDHTVEKKRAAGDDADGSPSQTDWKVDKHVHATVDEINAAVNEIIEQDGGLPPVTPPGSSSQS